MLKLSRRTLLIASGLQLLWPTRALLADVKPASQPDSRAQTLAAFLDIILPEDAVSPSASQLGIEQQVLANASKTPGLNRLLTQGCNWLNKQAKGSFSALPYEYKLQLVSWMAEKSSPKKLPGLFFFHARYHAVAYYYTNPDVAKSVGLPHPPQPRGYPELLSRTSHG